MADEIITEKIAVISAIDEAEKFDGLVKAEKIDYLLEKCKEYPGFETLDESSKINLLIGEKVVELEEKAIGERRARFEIARQEAFAKQHVTGEIEIEQVRVRVYKERLALEQKWNNAALTGTWQIPE